MWIYRLLETNLIPDFMIRAGIRGMLKQKLNTESAGDWEAQQAKVQAFVNELKRSPIAIETAAANTQHYEVPTEFFRLVLGPRLKYSCAYWRSDTPDLKAAEEVMLKLCCERAQLQNGMRILELGCGWGSLSLWMAEQYPDSSIVGVSNSSTQKAWIDAQAQARGLRNLEIITADMVHFDTDREFDRVVSVEMFEHMKNYELLMEKVSRWLAPQGQLFVHIFTHHTFAYHYEDTDGTDWMTRYFFTGGTMPSNHLLLYFQKHMLIDEHWVVNGQHYEKTANAWVDNMYRHRAQIETILADTYGAEQVTKWWVYWKVFFLACAELWGYQHGQQWFVSHYRFQKHPLLTQQVVPKDHRASVGALD